VDESGDTGLQASSTSYFSLSGIVVHESRWRDFLSQILTLRKTLRSIYALPLRAEIHAAEFIGSRIRAIGGKDIRRYDRLAILRNTLDELAKMDFISITNVIVDKATKPPDYDVFDAAWGTLFQRFENTMTHGNFPGAFKRSYGIVITDATSGRRLAQKVRKMTVINYVPSRFGGSRNIPIARLIEDPHGKNSEDTLPIQMSDVVTYFLHQRFKPNAYIRRQRAERYFDRLEPVLNKHARPSDPLGIVVL
jgi:hypothetical protein